MLRVYIDNDVASAVSRCGREKREESEVEALGQLLEWNRSGHIVLATSRQSMREMERAPGQYQSSLKDGLTELEIAKDDHQVLGSSMLADLYRGFISSPLVTDIVDEPLYSRLIGAALKSDDAKHLMYAAHNGYERFLTWDGNFLNRRDELERLCPSILVQKPSELVAELVAGSGS